MIKIGDKAQITKQFSTEDVELFANLSQDVNPIHLDDVFAEQTRFGKRIVHGMLSASLISAVLGNQLPGHGCVYLNQEISFKEPVYIGDTITAVVEVIEIRKDKPIVTLDTICKNQDETIVITGSAVLWVPQLTPTKMS